MLSFLDWSEEDDQEIGEHSLRVVSVPDPLLNDARVSTAAVVPDHYASPQRLARVFENLGKPGVASLLRTLLPREKTKRSGELGEIYATEYVDDRTEFMAPVKRLRWKDHREMPMRGDDVIGVNLREEGNEIRFLKVESKSQASLNTRTVEKARQALDKDDGLPSSHALAFIAACLIERGEVDLADAIDYAQLRDGISSGQVSHMLFAFSGNDPVEFLKDDLEGYGGGISQFSVGLRISQHQEFIASVFDEVLGNDDS